MASDWDDFWEGAGDIFEPHEMTQDERADWTAAVMYLQRVSDKSIPGDLPAGVVVLGGEIGKGEKALNHVYWKSAHGGNIKRLSKDWGEWRKDMVKALDRYGLADPRTDEDVRTWTTVATVAGAVAGAVLTAATLGTAAGLVGAGVAVGASAGYAAADAAEAKWASAMELKGVSGAPVVGSGSDKAIGATVGAAASSLAGSAASVAAAGGSAADVAAATGKAATSLASGYAGSALDAAAAYVSGAPVAPGTTAALATSATAANTSAVDWPPLARLGQRVGGPAVMRAALGVCTKRGLSREASVRVLTAVLNQLRAFNIKV